jgi:hypothetical protein
MEEFMKQLAVCLFIAIGFCLYSSNTYAQEVTEVKESILNIKVDSGLNKAWKSSWDSTARQAYSIRSFLQQFQTPIAIGIVIICCFVGFAILYSKIK